TSSTSLNQDPGPRCTGTTDTFRRTQAEGRASFLPRRLFEDVEYFPVINAEQRGCLDLVTDQRFHHVVVFLNLLDCLLVPSVGFFLVAQLPVGHGQEKPVEALATRAELHGLFQGSDGVFPVA